MVERDPSKDEANDRRRPVRAPVPSRRRAPRSEADFAWGFATATICGIVGPFLTWFFSPLVMILVITIALAKRDRSRPRSFPDGLLLGGLIWLLINGACSAFFAITLSQAYG